MKVNKVSTAGVVLLLLLSKVSWPQTQVHNLLADGSFEAMASELHTWTGKSDGGAGSWAVVSVPDAPDGKHIARMLQWRGSHTVYSPPFVPQSEHVTLSVFIRDNGFENSWGKRVPDGDAEFVFGIRDVATGQEQPLITGKVSQCPQWTRLVGKPATVTAGAKYQVYFLFNPYTGNQLVDIDALQVEEGTQATEFAGRPYVYEFVEAEDLQFDKDSGWRTVEGSGADIYEPVSRNHVLVGGAAVPIFTSRSPATMYWWEASPTARPALP